MKMEVLKNKMLSHINLNKIQKISSVIFLHHLVYLIWTFESWRYIEIWRKEYVINYNYLFLISFILIFITSFWLYIFDDNRKFINNFIKILTKLIVSIFGLIFLFYNYIVPSWIVIYLSLTAGPYGEMILLDGLFITRIF